MTRKNLILLHMSNEDADQPWLLFRLINAFISQSLESLKTKLVICIFSKFLPVSIVEHSSSRYKMHIKVHRYLE